MLIKLYYMYLFNLFTILFCYRFYDVVMDMLSQQQDPVVDLEPRAEHTVNRVCIITS